ncbi:MAG: DUF1761 domain-containing protein [Pseudomonadota bacterium]
MELINVIVAGAAAWMVGAVWYGVMGKAWMEDVGLTEETVDRKNPVPYIGSFLCAVIVAGMMRHIFESSGVHSTGYGMISGLGLGLFIAAPWLATNYLFAQRPRRLIFIDGMYATLGCTVIGLVLVLF